MNIMNIIEFNNNDKTNPDRVLNIKFNTNLNKPKFKLFIKLCLVCS